MTGLEQILDAAADIGCRAEKDVQMKDYTSFRIGGPADLLVRPSTIDQAFRIFTLCRETDCASFILGKGSNLLVSDEGFRGIVIYTGGIQGISFDGDSLVECAAGTSLSAVCRFALEHSLEGLEFAYGIPGSAGGAAYMNAGAYGGEMKDVLSSCSHIDPLSGFGQLSGDELQLGYRSSAYCRNGFMITTLSLRLNKGDKRSIKAKMDELMRKRSEKQPLQLPSAGSVFKRPEGYYAGALIEECGLKGKRIGGAMVSEKHAGFIVNTGNATSADVRGLIALITETVYKEKGVAMETEIKLIG